MKFILLLGLLLVSHTKRIDEWQTGVDYTINNNQKKLESRSNYPVSITANIEFVNKFSQIPKVALSYEFIEFMNHRETEFQMLATDISVQGFKLRYYVRGPAILKKLRVRWLALMDPLIEIQEVEYSYQDLTQLAYGSGKRENQFPITFKLHDPNQSRVVAIFLSGFKISTEGDSPFCLELAQGKINSQGFSLIAKTRHSSRVRMIKAFIVISPDYSNVVRTSEALAGPQNNFESKTITGLRHQHFKQPINADQFKHLNFNTFFQGISGFDVSSQTHLFEIGINHSYIKDGEFHMTYGPFGNSIVHAMQVSVVLHPPTVLMEAQKNHLLVHQGSSMKSKKLKGKKDKGNKKTHKVLKN